MDDAASFTPHPADKSSVSPTGHNSNMAVYGHWTGIVNFPQLETVPDSIPNKPLAAGPYSALIVCAPDHQLAYPSPAPQMATTLPLPLVSTLLTRPTHPLRTPRSPVLVPPRLLLVNLLPIVPPSVLTLLWWVPCMSIPVALFLFPYRPVSRP